MDTPQIDIVRGLPVLTLRAEGDDDGPVLEGHFSRFNEWYEIHSYWEGDFIERFAPGAFAESFRLHWDEADPHRTKVQFQHGWDSSVGQRLLGKLTDLREDDVGGYYACPLFDTSYNADLVPGLAAGEYGASFRFRVLAEEWDEEPGTSNHNPKGLPERSITKAMVYEVGPVAFGASPTATAGLRSLTDSYYELMRSAAPSQFAEVCRAAGRPAPDTAAARSVADAPVRRAGRKAGCRELKALPDAALERGIDLVPITTRRRGQELVEARRSRPELNVDTAEDGKATVEGYIAVYDEPRTVGGENGWVEIWGEGACARRLADADVRLTLNGEGIPLARAKAGDLTLTSDDYGLHLHAVIDPSTPRGEEAALALQRGDDIDVEVALDVIRQQWNDEHTSRSVSEVRIRDVAFHTIPSPKAARAVNELDSRSIVEPSEPDGDHLSLELAQAIAARYSL